MRRRSHTILFNSLSAYANMGIGLIVGLLTTRVAIQVLSSDRQTAKQIFGVFALLLAISGASQFLNDSLQWAMIRFLAVRRGASNFQSRRTVFTNGWLSSTCLGSLVALTLIMMTPWLIALFDVPEPLLVQAKWVLWIAAVVHLLTAMLQPWLAALLAQDRYALDNFRRVVQRILVLIGVAAIPWWPLHPLIALALAWLLPAVPVLASLAIWSALHDPALRVERRAYSKQHCKELFSLGGWTSILMFASRLYERTDQVLINLFLGPAYNTFYFVAVQLLGIATRLVAALAQVVLPTASRIAHAGNLREQQKLLVHGTRYIVTLAVPCVIVITVFRQEIIDAWLGEGFDETVRILPLLMLLMLFRAPTLLMWPFLTAIGKLKWPALALIIDAVTNVMLSIVYVVVFQLGLSGIVLGTLSTSLVRMVFFQFPYVANQAGMSLRDYFAGGFVRPAIGAVWFAPACMVAQQVSASPFATLAILTGLAAAYGAWVWWFIFESFERGVFAGLFGQVKKRVGIR